MKLLMCQYVFKFFSSTTVDYREPLIVRIFRFNVGRIRFKRCRRLQR